MIDRNSFYVGMPVVWRTSCGTTSGLVSVVWKSGIKVDWSKHISVWYDFDDFPVSMYMDVEKVRIEKLGVLGI